MKIVDCNGTAPDEVVEWVENLKSLDDSEFINRISSIKQWYWEELEDLAPFSSILNRVDSLLVSKTESEDIPSLISLLDFSGILLSAVHTKSLYNSVEELIRILDLPSWALVYKVLKLLKILAANPTKLTKAHKNIGLIQKLYILGLGSNLNNPSPISLQDLCSSSSIQKIPFQYFDQVDSIDSLPEKLRYVWINRQRTNESLDNVLERPLIVATQLLALSIFLQLSPESSLIQDFCKTLPEIWLLPAVSELIRTAQTIEVHTSALNLLSSILSMLESTRHESFHSQLAIVAHDIFAAWNGLMLNLLRDIAMPQTSALASVNHPDFVVSVLELASIIADSKHRVDTANLPGMTCSLICLLKSSIYAPWILTKAVKILSVLLPHSMDMFKEVDGMNTAITIATAQIRYFSEGIEGYDDASGLKVTLYSRVSLIKALLRLIKVALAKWDPVPGLSNTEIRAILDSGLMVALNDMFVKKKYEIYEEALVLITQMINENPTLVGDLVLDGTMVSLLDSLEVFIPCNPKFIDILARFLCITGFNIDGARVIEGYSIVSKLLLVLGNTDSSLFSNNTAVSIGESLQELIASVPNTVEKAIDGCVELVISLKSADLSNSELFFQKISNIGKLFTHTFNFTTDLIKGFINRGGLDYLLEIFRLPVLPRYFNNEFYSLTACFKSLPVNLTNHVLVKVMQSLNSQLQRLQDITGSFSAIKDFSTVVEADHATLMHTLTEGDCYLEIIRVILQNWAGISNNYKDFSELLEKLAVLLRLLIAEQARLLCASKPKDQPCERFNIPIDISVIENTELKSYEENLYFCCQLTIRRVFRLAMKIPSSRGRQASNEEAGLAISRVMGEIFTQNIKVLTLDEISFEKAYHLAMQLSDIMKILLYEQGSTPATVLTFSLAGGTEHFSNFLVQLKKVSFEVSKMEKMPYHLVNGLQILWNLSGKFLESLVMGKYLSSNYGQFVIKALGYENSKEVVKKMQLIVLDCLKKVNFLECGLISTSFGKSVLEILKSLSNLTKETGNIDSKAIKAVVDMGFSTHVARQALAATGTASVEMAMDWIFSHPEVMDLPPEPESSAPVLIESLHQKLINALPGIPSLSTSIAEILIKISNTSDANQADIALMLLSLVGKLAFDLLEEGNLMEVTSGMAELSLSDIPATFEQLAACLHVVQSLAVKSSDILEIIRDNNFSWHAIQFLKKATVDQFYENWIGNVFSILDILIKSGEECSNELVIALVEIIKINNTSADIILKEPEMLNLLNLLVTITFSLPLAKLFVDESGLKNLLLARTNKPDSQNKGIMAAWGTLLKQLCEDPFILQASFEILFLQTINNKILLDTFLKAFKSQANRSKDIFNLAFTNACTVVRRDEVYVEKNKNRVEIQGERWNTVKIIGECLGEVFNIEQKGEMNLYLNSEKIHSLLGDLLQSYPRLISDLVALNITTLDVLSSLQATKPFLTHLIRNIIPFRYALKIEDNKILFYYPNTTVSVTSSVFQNWVKTSVKLLRSLTLKQVYKQPESQIADIYNLIVLNHNAAVVKSRKRIIKELKDILSDQIKKNWFENEKSMTLVRCVATIIMQLLREPPKAPFATTGSVELARILTSDIFPIIKLLSEALKGINLSFKRAGSVFNLLLAPLELLTKYSLNFIIKLAKPQEFSEAPIELYPEPEYVEESSEESHQSAEEPLESSDSAEEQPPLDDIVIESWNTEAFWADDLEEEEEEEFPRRNLEARPYDVIIAERALLEQEIPQPHLNYRNIFRDYDENAPGSALWREYENDDLIQVLLQRSRSHNRQEPPPEPVFPRSFPESNDYLRQLSIHLSEIAQEEPLVEHDQNSDEELPQARSDEEPLRPNEEPDIVDEAMPHAEEQRPPLPEGIDPSFLEALPDDIRNEILAQYQRPSRENAINEEFLQALPPELRNEVMMQQRPPPHRPAAEMDNATFVASLTPDLRREVLMSANEEFLATLPPDLVAEARLLQERVIQRDQYFMGRQPAPRKRQAQEEDKTISNIVADEKLANSLVQVDDSLLEILLKGLYLSTPINRDILSSLLLNLSVQHINRSKIIDGLVSLLLTLDTKSEFPPKKLYGSESFLENYNKVYAIVSVRVIDILQHIVVSNPKAAIDLTSPLKQRLSLIKAIRPEETHGFQDLISLMDQTLFRTSSSHLTPLVSLLSSIVAKLGTKIPSINQIAIDRLCSLLSFESLNENSVKNVIEMVTKLSEMETNKEQVVKALKYQIRVIGQEVAVTLNKLETSANGLKEIQLLRLCKVITGASGASEDIDFLWGPLTEALSQITKKETQLASTTNPVLNKLLPLIESFFISHYERSNSETFRSFTEKNCKVINLLIRQNPNLLNDTFNSLVVRFPALLDFENKRTYFKSEMRELRPERGHDTIRLNLRRSEVFMDSFHQLKVRSPSEMHGKLRIQFVGEEGLDAGGLTREWYGLLSREMFNPNYALFIPSANGVSFQPNSMSSINTEHIQFFKFVGRIIGKALCDGYPLDLYFTRSFYKHILGQEVTYQDMEDLDVDFYKSLKSLMDINLDESELHEYYFAYEEEEFGRHQLKELIPDGKTKRVTEENKIDYIKLLCHMKMTKNIQAQIDAFKAGFHELVPAELISIFDSKELELLISGLPSIDLEDLQANTDYYNYTKDSEVIGWLWEVLNEFSREERAEFLQFVTGSSKVPLEGFKALPGMGGFQKFQIHKSFAGSDRLPTAHTCMNQLDLPEYPDKEKLRNRLKFAVSEGKEGFGFV